MNRLLRKLCVIEDNTDRLTAHHAYLSNEELHAASKARDLPKEVGE